MPHKYPSASLRNTGRVGVTLVEMLVVIGLFGLMAAIVAPRIDFEHYQIEGGMQAASTTLMAAQREAVAKQHNVVVMFDTVNSSLRILYDLNNNGSVDLSERIRVLQLDTHVRFGRAGAPVLPAPLDANAISFTHPTSGLPSVTFHRNGSASKAGGFYLTSVRAAAGVATHQRDTRALELYRATGRPEWWRYNGTTWTRGF